MANLLIVIAMVGAYLMGSFPSAFIMGRLRKGVDIRQVGSRNMGAMNVFYTVGFVEGALVLALDVAKGAAAVALARYLGLPEVVQLLAGLAAILGHIFPVFLGFRGGKGGAVCIGVLSFLMPWGIPVFSAVFVLVLAITHYPTLSYSVALAGFPFVAGWVYHRWELVVFSVAILLLPGIRYLPRLKEMRVKGGSWRHVFLRKGLKDRL